jgi:hypothetical protein
LYANDDEIADLATKFLMEILYEKVSLKLKKDISQLHGRFIQECYEKLEVCLFLSLVKIFELLFGFRTVLLPSIITLLVNYYGMLFVSRI